MIWMSMVCFVAFVIFFIILKNLNKDTNDSDKLILKIFAGAFGGIGGLLFFFSIFSIIPVGNVGIQVIFGKASQNILENGLRTKNPFTSVQKMSVKTQELKESAQVPSKEGLIMDVDISLLYRLNPQTSFEVYTKVGKDYQSVIVEPQLRSAIREITSSYEAKVLYSSERDKISNEIYSLFKKMTEHRGIITEQLLLRDIGLPKVVSDAIEQKLEAEQRSEQMKFTLMKETQEAERKRIEARGVSDFQHIVSEGINDNLLKWKGIEATEALAKSPNAKIVVIGGRDGMPLILNAETK